MVAVATAVRSEMIVLAILVVLASALAEDPSDKSTFHDTGNVLWKDCGGPDAWLQLSQFDMTPSPLVLPGPSTLTLHGINGNTAINQNVVLDVTIKKRLLSRWTTVPCTGDLGTCRYDDPCHFMHVLFPDGECPHEFVDHGLPCTCPFSVEAGKTLNLNNDPIQLGAPSPTYNWLTTGDFYLKLVLYQKGGIEERMCLEFYTGIHTL